MAADFVSGDTASTLRVPCTDDEGAVINLSGCTVKLRWREATGIVADRTMTIVDAGEGICSYKFLTGELFAPSMSFEVKITDASEFLLRSIDLIDVMVREAL